MLKQTQYLKIASSILLVGAFLFLACGSDKSKNGAAVNTNIDCSTNSGAYSMGYSAGSLCKAMGDYSSCEGYVQKYNYATGRNMLEASECYCEGFEDGKEGNPKKYDSSNAAPTSNTLASETDETETKWMTFKWCECNDMCYSLFIDEQGNEYDFGDVSGKNDIDFQCYTNNSNGGITDDLRGQKFRVTYIKRSKNDFELIHIDSDDNSQLEGNSANKHVIPKDAVKGDFNGDHKIDYMWLEVPELNKEESDCMGECVSYIRFSDATIPSIKVDDCISGSVSNLGDLNENGTDEIGLLPGWFTSCWRAYFVWSLKNRYWIKPVEPFSTHCDQWTENINPIEIDRNHKGNVIIRYSEHTGEDIITKSKSVKITK